jgi:hypothetical protein
MEGSDKGKNIADKTESFFKSFLQDGVNNRAIENLMNVNQ